jgi:hypothetical protein
MTHTTDPEKVIFTDELPSISCYCSTFGRPKHILENSIQCFLEQDYKGPKELVILNDLQDQELEFNHPEIRIINYPSRIKPLGKKFNINIENCKYEYLATWEDDDFFLSNRLSFGVANMKNGVFHTHDGFVQRGFRKIEKTANYFHSQHIFTKKLFNEIGGYAERDQCTIDIELMEKLRKAVGEYSTKLTNEDDYSYVYVWAGADSYHGSGMGIENMNISDSAFETVKQQINNGIVKTGNIKLNPKLRYNIYDFLPTRKGIFKLGSASIYYGIDGQSLINVTGDVIGKCIDEGDANGIWSMPKEDVYRSKIFGDPLPNVIKKVYIGFDRPLSNVVKKVYVGFDRLSHVFTLEGIILNDTNCQFKYNKGILSICN